MTIERTEGRYPVETAQPGSLFRHTAASACLLMLVPAWLAGQMPGAPVLQNAWAAPGIVVALDIGGGSGGSVYAGAAAWAPGGARFQLSGGAGMQTSTGTRSRGVYGVRAAIPLMQMMGGNLGIAAFGGIGGGAGDTKDTTRANTVIPAGLAIGYRRAVGTRGGGFSAYVDPTYSYQSGSKGSAGFFRVAAGVDAGITSRFGLTVGIETGAGAATGKVGPTSALYGVGVSMKIGG